MPIEALLPPHLVEELARREAAPGTSARTVVGTLLLCDISGFTSLTERLQDAGREGAERIARLVSRVFRPAVGAIERRRGSILGFGGDSILALFSGAGSAARALAAAREIQDSFSGALGRPGVDAGGSRVVLQVSQAIHHGAMRAVHLGPVEGRRHHLLAGDVVARVARLQAGASPGEILRSPAARAAERGRAAAVRAWRGGAPRGRLLPYVPAMLRGRGLRGAFRPVVILFLESRGHAVPRLAEHFEAIVRALTPWDATLLKSDPSAEGTRWLCVFGLPRAHEEQCRHAAHAAATMMAEAGASMRGALHPGIAATLMMGTSSRRSFEVMGDVVNTAARALSEARWGELLLTRAAADAIPGLDAGPFRRHAVKGKRGTLELLPLERPPSLERPAVATPLVGRARQLAVLHRALRAARLGRGGTLAIEGGAGFGKSRLAREAIGAGGSGGGARGALPFRVLQAAGSPRDYGAVAAIVRDALGLGPGVESSRLLAATADLGLAAVDVHHLAEALGSRLPGSPLAHLDPRTVRINVAIAVRELLLRLSRRAPLLVVVDDHHRCDSGSQEVLAEIARRAPDGGLLLVVASRERVQGLDGARSLAVGPLAPRATLALVRQLAPELPSAGARKLALISGGSPLFAEQLVRGARELDPGMLHVAESLESLVAARLDELSPGARRIVDVASVAGPTLEERLLAGAAAGHRPAEVAEVVARGLLERAGDGYRFRDVVVQEIAYAGLLGTRRRQLHLRLARLLGRDDDGSASHLERRARHLDLGGAGPRAGDLYARAGGRFIRAGALREAERTLRRALALARPGPERAALQTTLGNDVLAATGRQSEAVWLLQAAGEEARRHGAASVEARALLFASRTLQELGDPGGAEEHLRRAEAIAERIGDEELASLAMSQRATAFAFQGLHREAEEVLREAIARFRGRLRDSLVATDLANLALSLQHRGEMAAAKAYYEESLALLPHEQRRRRAAIVANLALLHTELHETARARALFDEAIAAFVEMGDRRLTEVHSGNLAVLLINDGRFAEATKLLLRAVETARDVGDVRFEARHEANLAVVMLEQGRYVAATRRLERALELARRATDRHAEGLVLANLARATARRSLPGARGMAERTIALARELADPRLQGMGATVLGEVAMMEGDLAGAREAVALAEPALRNAAHPEELVEFLCVKAELAIRSGEEAGETLAEARGIVAAARLPGASPLARYVARVARLDRRRSPRPHAPAAADMNASQRR